MAEAVGFIGLGIMGSRQAASLRRAGFELTVYNRTRERAEAWAAEHGGRVAASPREVAERSDVVITMVVDGAAGRGRCCSARTAPSQGARPGTLFVDMSTIGPAEARRIGAALAERGHAFVDAPVTGSAPQGRGRDADDHGRRQRRGHGARACRLLEAMGEIDRPRRRASAPASRSRCSPTRSAPPTARRSRRRWSSAGGPDVDLEALLKVMGARLGELDDAAAQGRADARATTSRRCSSSSTCSRTSACASRRRARPAPPSRPPRSRASSTPPARGRGLGEQDFAAVLEVVEGLNDTRL